MEENQHTTAEEGGIWSWRRIEDEKSNRPNQAHRSRPSEATDQALRSQRKKFLRSHGACDERVSDSLLLWKRFVASIAFDQKKWDAAPLFKMFSVTINDLAPSPTEPDAPPICLLVCKAFLDHIMAWKNTRTTGSGAACCDVSWKLNIAGWGLVTIAGMATHFVKRDGHMRCMCLPYL